MDFKAVFYSLLTDLSTENVDSLKVPRNTRLSQRGTPVTIRTVHAIKSS